MRRFDVVVLLSALMLAVAACGTEAVTTTAPPESDGAVTSDPPPTTVVADDESESTEFEPFDYDNFDNPTVIDNQWLPLVPWTQLTFEGTTDEDDELLEHEVVSIVTDMTKVIDGIESVVVWDLDYSDEELVEAELAFFAQDNDGNVWRMGEHPEEYEDGEVVDAPTWLAGVADARAGIAMLGDPQEGSTSYSQGWAREVEFSDRAVVGQVGQETCVPTDCYTDVLVVDEFNVEEPGAFQHKYFAPGIGNVQVDWSGSDETHEELELVSIETLSGDDQDEARSAVLDLEAHAYEISPDVYGLTDPITE